MKTVLILPHQLFYRHELIENGDRVLLAEHPHFFTRLRFHKQKIMLHRASMKAYEDELLKKGVKVEYVEFEDWNDSLLSRVDSVYDPIEKPLQKIFVRQNITVAESPMFLSTNEWNRQYFHDHAWHQTHYYIAMRKRLNILVGEDGEPRGGRWSFDADNRKKLPEDITIPKSYTPKESDYIQEAREYAEKHFANNPGETEEFIWPIQHHQALRSLERFLETKLKYFGDYQDAFERDEPFLFHALISSSLNIGLLSPTEVIKKTLAHGESHKIPINALEGFLRQIIGWREYVRAVYDDKGSKLAQRNYWNFRKSLPQKFYSGDTGLIPVDDAIKRTLKFAYAHHIERLMVLGNIMLLMRIHPKYVLRWFSELYIDAYDWVMIPNVMGMSQYADGGGMVTKPYISSSNYIRKMSHYKKGHWSEVWDGLYWCFVDDYKDVLKKNHRFGFIMKQLSSMDQAKLSVHKHAAARLLN